MLLNGTPETLDTIQEIAEALQNNPDVVDTLLGAVAAEETRAKAAEAALQTAIDQEVSDRVAAIDQVSTALLSEIVAREQADAAADLFNSQARQAIEDELSAEIAVEKEQRIAADQAIASDLAVEITRAKDAEDALRSDIQQEVFDRINAVSSVQSALDQEIVDREVADIEICNKIAAETTARTDAIANLNTKILEETSARTSADTVLEAAITSEVNRALLAEQTLDTKIQNVEEDLASETVRAKAAEQQLSVDKLDRVDGTGIGLHTFDRLNILGTEDEHSVYLTFGKWRISAHHNGSRLCFEYNQSLNGLPDWQTAVPFITGAKNGE